MTNFVQSHCLTSPNIDSCYCRVSQNGSNIAVAALRDFKSLENNACQILSFQPQQK